LTAAVTGQFIEGLALQVKNKNAKHAAGKLKKQETDILWN